MLCLKAYPHLSNKSFNTALSQYQTDGRKKSTCTSFLVEFSSAWNFHLPFSVKHRYFTRFTRSGKTISEHRSDREELAPEKHLPRLFSPAKSGKRAWSRFQRGRKVKAKLLTLDSEVGIKIKLFLIHQVDCWYHFSTFSSLISQILSLKACY